MPASDGGGGPEDEDFIVYPDGDDRVLVVYEPGGGSTAWERHDVRWQVQSDPQLAAVAYFDAHPEPKPWEQDPRIGDIWEFVLKTGGKPIAAVLRAVNGGEWRWAATDSVVDFTTVESARRIYPESTV